MNVVLQKQVDGLLLVPARSSGDSIVFLQERKATVVVLDRRVSDVRVDTVRGEPQETDILREAIGQVDGGTKTENDDNEQRRDL